jgi:hypothetical protein
VKVDDPIFGTRYLHPEEAKKREVTALLLKNIKARVPELEKLLAAAEDHWVMEDGVYRFYHQSFKVYDLLHPITSEITEALQKLLPHHELNIWFIAIVTAGTEERFKPEYNQN